MAMNVVEAALDRFKKGKFQYKCLHEMRDEKKHVAVYELTSTCLEGYYGQLKAEIWGNTGGNEDIYLTWSLPLAIVEDLSASPLLLLQNLGGLKNSSFYFALSKQGDDIYLIAEAKANDRVASEDLIFWRMFNWYDDAPFMTTWNIPPGVTPIHPGYQAR